MREEVKGWRKQEMIDVDWAKGEGEEYGKQDEEAGKRESKQHEEELIQSG